jgi:short-subunit dehydrogenase
VTAKYSGEAFRTRFGPWAVIAGGSDGIGESFARELARRGVNVAAIARRPEPLAALVADLRRAASPRARSSATSRAKASPRRSRRQRATSTSACSSTTRARIARRGASSISPSRPRCFLERLSCRAPLLLAHHFGTRLRARRRGGMILMSSLAGLAGAHYQATYAATKAFDTMLAEGLWHELTPDGVDVLGVLAGATRTPTALAESEKFRDQDGSGRGRRRRARSPRQGPATSCPASEPRDREDAVAGAARRASSTR